MLPRDTVCKKTTFKKNKRQQGFAVLTSAILLSVAGIIFTTNMASSQLVDNQIIGNYYRNNEAFANAESGMNFVLGKLDDEVLRETFLADLPSRDSEKPHYEVSDSSRHYSVQINKIHASKLEIISVGTSMDDTAESEIQLQVDFYNSFPIPDSPISVNGKINFSKFNLGDPNCKGIAASDCLTNGNTADKVIESNPNILGKVEGDCAGVANAPNNAFNKNSIDLSGISEGGTDEGDYVIDNGGNWESNIQPGSTIFGADAIFFAGASSPDPVPSNSFEATYGLEFNETNIGKIKDNAVVIDGAFCGEQLEDISDEDDVIYITGDCIIGISDEGVEQSASSENKVYTFGTVDHPKLVFIEGGTIKVGNDNANAGAKIVGMLHAIPKTTFYEPGDTIPSGYEIGDAIPLENYTFDESGKLVENIGGVDTFVDLEGNVVDESNAIFKDDLASVNMGGITVAGALLSEYKCTSSGTTVENQDEHSSGQTNTKEHFSATYDKLILGALYSQMGLESEGSRYRLVSGTWRDF